VPCSRIKESAAVSGEGQNVLSEYCWHMVPLPAESITLHIKWTPLIETPTFSLAL
jgi:hypothetical protein